MKMEFDAEKFRELVLYIAQRSINDAEFGMTKLAKILCWSDFLKYALHGKPITGATYLKKPFGPLPQELAGAQQGLVRDHEASIQEVPYFLHLQRRLAPERRANLSRFSGEEIALVDEVIDALRGFNATQLSELSHERLVGWKLAQDGEEIPYSTIFLSPEPPTADDITWAKQVAEEQGLLSPT